MADTSDEVNSKSRPIRGENQTCEGPELESETSLISTTFARTAGSMDMDSASKSAPIETIPAEILAEIMVLTLPQCDFALTKWDEDVKWRNVLRLTGVSRQWKYVGEHTSKLWSCFRVELSGTSESRAKIYLTRTWISRSGAAPLNVSFVLPFYWCEPPANEQVVAEWLNVLKPNLHRCKTLKLSAPPNQLSGLWTSANTSQLENLFILNELDDSMTLEDAEDLGSDVGIRRLHLKGISPRFNLESFDWSSITHLTLDVKGKAFLACMTILGECPDLLSLRLSIGGLKEAHTRRWWNRPRPRPTYERLHTLEVDAFESYADFTHFLDWLYVPALRHLKIKGNIFLFPGIMDIITRDGCALEELDVFQTDGNPSEEEEGLLIELFEALPQLRTLKLVGEHFGAFGPEVVEGLTYGPRSVGRPLLLPMLENMTVDWIGTSCSARLVEKMLESRARLDDDAGVPRLKSAQVIQNWTNGFHHKRHDWTIQGSGEIKHSGYTKTPWRIDNF